MTALLAPGDRVEVDGGATYAGDITFTKPGTSAAKITIVGIRVNGKRPILSGGTNTVALSGDHYILKGFEITAGSSRCVFHHADDITIVDSVIHDCKKHGILGADEDAGALTLDYVEVYASGAGTQHHPIYVATDERTHPGSVFRMQHCFLHDNNGGNAVKSRAERNEIYSNWIEGATYREIELIGPDGEDPDLVREDSDVVGNVFRKTNTFYTARLGGDGTADTGGRYRFVNNTFILNAGTNAVFQLFDRLESVEMHNNVFFMVGGGGVPILKATDASWTSGKAIIAGTHNWVPKGSTAIPSQWVNTFDGTDPGFVDVAADDYRPSAASPLVNAGATLLKGIDTHLFPSALARPISMPPLHELESVGDAIPCASSGPMTIGAFEREVYP